MLLFTHLHIRTTKTTTKKHQHKMWQCVVITARVGRSHRMRSLGLIWTLGRSLVFDKVGEADDYCLGAAPPGAHFNVDELHIPLSQVVDDDKFRTNMVDCLLPAAKKDSRGRMRKMEIWNTKRPNSSNAYCLRPDGIRANLFITTTIPSPACFEDITSRLYPPFCHYLSFKERKKNQEKKTDQNSYQSTWANQQSISSHLIPPKSDHP